MRRGILLKGTLERLSTLLRTPHLNETLPNATLNRRAVEHIGLDLTKERESLCVLANTLHDSSDVGERRGTLKKSKGREVTRSGSMQQKRDAAGDKARCKWGVANTR